MYITEALHAGTTTIILCICQQDMTIKVGSQYDATPYILHYVAFALTLVATQCNARIDSDPILAFLCGASLRLIAKKSLKFLIAFRKLTQCKALRHIVNQPLVYMYKHVHTVAAK